MGFHNLNPKQEPEKIMKCKNCEHDIDYAWTENYHKNLYHFCVEEGEYYPEATIQCLVSGCSCTKPEVNLCVPLEEKQEGGNGIPPNPKGSGILPNEL